MKVNINWSIHLPSQYMTDLFNIMSIHGNVPDGNGSSYKHFLFQKDENWRFEFKIIIYSFLTIPQQWMWKNNVQQNFRAFLVSKRT